MHVDDFDPMFVEWTPEMIAQAQAEREQEYQDFVAGQMPEPEHDAQDGDFDTDWSDDDYVDLMFRMMGR